MRFLIIIPAHNEEPNITFCLEALRHQTFADFHVVVVNDGSTDGTEKVVQDFVDRDSRFSLKNLDKSVHEPGAKVVRTFNHGLAQLDLDLFDVICKFDADIIFPADYLQKVHHLFSESPKAGMVSGLVRVKKSLFEKQLAYDFKDQKRQWVFENLSSKDHVRGPIKAYRKQCFLDIGGLRPVLGWDNIDVMLAKKHGWEVNTIKDLWVKHLRPTAYKYKNQKAQKLGQYFYNIGLSLPLAAVSSAKSSLKNKSLSEFFITMNSYIRQNSIRELTQEEIRYMRNLRWKEMWQKSRLK